jgi:hypothetical protein
MLGIEQQPIEAGAGEDLGGGITHHAVPEADLLLAGQYGALEGIYGQVHV